MDIEFTPKRSINCKELNIGDVFAHNGYIYMLTNMADKEGLWAVNLKNGKTELFNKYVPVEKCNSAKLVIGEVW